MLLSASAPQSTTDDRGGSTVNPRHHHRWAFPLALLLLGIWLHAGCVYIPTFNMTVGGKDASQSVGPAGSEKQLQPQQSTRADVQRVLGKPFYATTDGRFWVYSWQRQKGIMIWPLCFTAEGETDAFAVTLEFDAQSVVNGVDFQTHPGRIMYFDVPHASRFVPMKVLLHQKELDLQRDHPELLERFRAATRAADERAREMRERRTRLSTQPVRKQ